jgi:S-adenosylmethionine decarboxylase
MEIVSQVANRSLGRHILAEFWGGCHLASPLLLEEALKVAAIKAGATILGSFAHHFGEEQGVTSVVILSESHISIHTWPEHKYSAIDVFMCGKANPHIAIEALRRSIQPDKVSVNEYSRGKLSTDNP